MFFTAGFSSPGSNSIWHTVLAATLSLFNLMHTSATHFPIFFTTFTSWWESSSYFLECFNLLMFNLKIVTVHNLFQNQMLIKCTICFISQRFIGIQRKSIIALLGIPCYFEKMECFLHLSPMGEGHDACHPWQRTTALQKGPWRCPRDTALAIT